MLELTSERQWTERTWKARGEECVLFLAAQKHAKALKPIARVWRRKLPMVLVCIIASAYGIEDCPESLS